MGFRETVRFGEENVPELEENQDGVARNSVDLDETLEGENLRHVNDSGADEISKGISSATLAECLNRMGAQTSTRIPATYAMREGNVGGPPYTNSGQIMSPNSRQNLAQDPLHVRELPGVEIHIRPNEPSDKCKEEKTRASVPKREEVDVEEEPEFPSLVERETPQPSQSSQLPPEQSADPEHTTYYQDTRTGPSEAPWVYVMNREKSVQFACEQLRDRTNGIEAGNDMSELRERQDNLSNRVRQFEESVNPHHVNDCIGLSDWKQA